MSQIVEKHINLINVKKNWIEAKKLGMKINQLEKLSNEIENKEKNIEKNTEKDLIQFPQINVSIKNNKARVII